MTDHSRSPALLCLCLLCLSLPLAARAGENDKNRPAIAKDLQLRVKRVSARTVKPQQPIKLEVELVNTSRTRSHHVVKPGDGSAVGWREPHVYYTAESRKQGGGWKELPRRPLTRCGLYSPDWQKDVVELKPGKSLRLKDWVPPPERGVDLQKAGEVRLYLHYKYSQGRAAKGRSPGVSKNTGRMGRTPSFHLISRPIALKVVRPVKPR